MWRICVLACVLCVASTAGLDAQALPDALPRAGSRVRVDTDSGVLSGLRRFSLRAVTGRTVTGQPGTLVVLGGDTLVLQPDGTDSSVVLPLSSIRRLYVSSGPGSRARDGAVGLVTGAVAGLLITAVMDQVLREGFVLDYGRAAMIAGAAGLASGVIFGGQERWQRVSLPLGSSSPNDPGERGGVGALRVRLVLVVDAAQVLTILSR